MIIYPSLIPPTPCHLPSTKALMCVAFRWEEWDTKVLPEPQWQPAVDWCLDPYQGTDRYPTPSMGTSKIIESQSVLRKRRCYCMDGDFSYVASWTLLIFQQKHQSYICKNGPCCLVLTLRFAVSKVINKEAIQNAVFSAGKRLRKTYDST